MGKATPTVEQRRLVALWRGSTLSMAAFARSRGVLPATFGSWVARHDRPLAVPSTPGSFIQVTPAPVAAAATTFVVHVDDHELRFEVLPPPTWFAAVLRALSSC
jgi:hypothetical protein